MIGEYLPILQSNSTSPRWRPSHPQPLVLQTEREEWRDDVMAWKQDSGTQTDDASPKAHVAIQTDDTGTCGAKKPQARKPATQRRVVRRHCKPHWYSQM